MKKFNLFLLLMLAIGLRINAQSYNDGPMELLIRVTDVRVDYHPDNTQSDDFNLSGSICGLYPPLCSSIPSLAADEISCKVWARDNLGGAWQGGTCFEGDLPMSSGGPETYSIPSAQQQIATFTFPGATVPMYFDLKVDAWEDDKSADFDQLPSTLIGIVTNNCQTADGFDRCTFEGNGVNCFSIPIIGGILNESDDIRCNADPFMTNIDYRAAGPPCQWNSHGFIAGNCPSNNYYQPRVESFYRFTIGSACNNAIDLGTLTPGVTLSHFNSNQCYSNNWSNSPGNDVFYKFTINAPIGVNISVCGVNTNFDTYLYLLNDSCTLDDSNDDGCGTQSIISKSLCRTGVYYVVVDGKLASSQGTFRITIDENPNFTFAASTVKTDPTCNGYANGSAEVNIIGGVAPFDYVWSNGGTDTTISGLLAGPYTVTVTDDDGCTLSAMTNLVNPPAITVTTFASDLTCSGANDGTASAVVSGGTQPYGYAWSGTPQQAANVFNLPVGSYTVTVTDLNGCTATSPTPAVVNANNPIIIDTTSFSNVSCFGVNDGAVTINVNGGIPPYTYSWSNGNTTNSVTGLAPGNISVTVYDNTGTGTQCFATENFLITEPSLLTSIINAVRNVSCNGGSDGAVDLGVSGGTPPYTYSWSNTTAGEDLLSSAAGPVTVTVTDANQCSTTSSTTINEPAALTASIVPTNSNCAGDSSGAADLTVAGGTAPYTYFWSNTATTEDISNIPAGSYLVAVMDANGCQTLANTSISEYEDVLVQSSVAKPSCMGKSDGSIQLTVVNGTAPFTFVWAGSDSAGQSITNIPAGFYQVEVTDANGCSQDLSFTIDEPLEDNCTTVSGTYVAIPNAFSPNGDSYNDRFDYYASDDVVKVEVKIFDRWGSRIYENPNQAPGLNNGWDGKISGNDAQMGTYVYVFNIEYSNANPNPDLVKQRTGTITLIR